MKDAYSIIRRPLITEKSMGMVSVGKYVFEVAITSNKVEIAQAIKTIFKVDAVKVNTLRVKGKTKRVGKHREGRTADWKKAYISLKPGQKIEIFEGA